MVSLFGLALSLCINLAYPPKNYENSFTHVKPIPIFWSFTLLIFCFAFNSPNGSNKYSFHSFSIPIPVSFIKIVKGNSIQFSIFGFMFVFIIFRLKSTSILPLFLLYFIAFYKRLKIISFIS